jgi:hypothetical protein
MSLSFTGPAGTAEHRWVVVALLRDNVQHYLENGRASGTRFPAVHTVDQALGGNPVAVNALALRGELERASVLLARPISDLAISTETRAIIDRSWRAKAAPADRTTVADGKVAISWLSPGGRTLDDVFGNLIRSLLAITMGAGEADLVEVDDG